MAGKYLSWSCGDEPSGSIRYITYNDRLELIYRSREHGGDWEDVEYSGISMRQTVIAEAPGNGFYAQVSAVISGYPYMAAPVIGFLTSNVHTAIHKHQF